MRASSDRKTRNQIDCILKCRRWLSSVTYEYIQSFRGEDCDTDHYLVAEKLRKRLAVNKRTTQKFIKELFSLENLNKVEDKRQYWG
jgi:hypothetical protein